MTDDVGDWWGSGRVGCSAHDVDVVVRNGQVHRRRGDVVDGQTLAGAPRLVPMGNGDAAELWTLGITTGEDRRVVDRRIAL